jgi:hypothetical protein
MHKKVLPLWVLKVELDHWINLLNACSSERTRWIEAFDWKANDDEDDRVYEISGNFSIKPSSEHVLASCNVF